MEMAHGISVNTESKLVKFVSRVKYANYAIKYLPFRNPLDWFLCLLDEFHVKNMLMHKCSEVLVQIVHF